VNLRRLRIGEWIVGIGGVLLLATTFLDWYDVESRRPVEAMHSAGVMVAEGSLSAWEAFSVIDVLIAFLAVLAIGAAVMAAAHNTPAVSLAMASMSVWIGLFTLIALLVRAIAMPDFALDGFVIPDDDVSVAAGLWLGLGACALTVAGAFASIRDERFPRAARIEVPVETIPPPEGGTA
jgi:hypothetical protein